MKLYAIVLCTFLVGCGVFEGSKGDTGNPGEQGRKGDSGGTTGSNTILNNISSYVDSVLDIECNDGYNYWRGTGAKVSGGRILTANHVVAEATYCTYFSDEKAFAIGGGASSITQNYSQDLAFINGVTWTMQGDALPEKIRKTFVGGIHAKSLKNCDFDPRSVRRRSCARARSICTAPTERPIWPATSTTERPPRSQSRTTWP